MPIKKRILMGFGVLVVAGIVWLLNGGSFGDGRPNVEDRLIGSAGLGDPVVPDLGNGGFDVQSYDLLIEWEKDNTIVGEAVIAAEATTDLTRFNLDLADLDVSAVTVDSVDATYSQEDTELQITPSRTITEGDEFSVFVSYSGKPTAAQDGIIESGWHVHDAGGFTLGEPRGASHWFPSNDHPSDKATYTLQVKVPAGTHVASNGTLQQTSDSGDGELIWEFADAGLMASYLTTVIIGNYETLPAGSVDGIELRNVFPLDASPAEKQVFDNHDRMIEVLSLSLIHI